MADIKSTVFHEAGHAVVAWFVGLEPTKASVIPADDYLGYVHRRPAFGERDDPQYEKKPGDQERAMLSAMVSLAGTIAQRKSGHGRVMHNHGRQDRLQALAHAELFCETDEEARAWLKLCQIRTEQVVEYLWPAVESLASHLHDAQELDAGQIEQAIQEGMHAVAHFPTDRTCCGEIWASSAAA